MGGADVITDPPAPRSWWPGPLWGRDALIAAVVFLYNLLVYPVYVPREAGPLTVAFLISVGMCAPMLLRGRRPGIASGVIVAFAWVQLALGIPPLPVDVTLLVAVYTLASRFGPRLSLPVAGVVVAWVLVAFLPRLDELYMRIGEVLTLLVTTVLCWTVGALTRTRRAYVAGLHARARQLERDRETQARIAVVEERARIAREIHDVVSHGLGVVVVLAEGAAATVETDPARARSAMLTVRDTGRDSLVEMRRVLDVLREDEPGPQAPQPGLDRLPALVDDVIAAGLPVSMHVEGAPVPLTSGVDLAAYRVVQEALTNVRKHASTVEDVQVRLRYTDDRLDVRVTDDGRGFDDAPTEPGSGRGLVGMRERVSAYGGTLHAGMRPSGGFEVVATLPIKEGA